MKYLYYLLIQPLIFVYDIIFTVLFDLIQEPILTIVTLSVVINYLVLPLYKKADVLQKGEQEKQKKMKKWVEHIRKTFNGDERFMIQSAYYKVEHYNPLSVFKEIGPLALQIPFFIAAYRYISTLAILNNTSFGPIKDLLRPDGLIVIGGITVNVLPIIMTAINMISGYVYSKDGSLQQKIQIYGTALLFLVLLYNCPSALVIYWISNNIFSLVRNIYSSHKTQNARLYIILFVSIAIVIILSFSMLSGHIDTYSDETIAVCLLGIIVINLIREVIKLRNENVSITSFVKKHIINKDRKIYFFVALTILFILTVSYLTLFGVIYSFLFVAISILFAAVLFAIAVIIIKETRPEFDLLISRPILKKVTDKREHVSIIILTEISLFLLLGLYIPSSVVASSVAEFINRADKILQPELIIYPALVYAGLLVVWSSVLIFSKNQEKHRIIAVILWMLLGIALLNQFVFPSRFGTLFTDLSFDGTVNVEYLDVVVNIVASIAIAIGCFFLYWKRPNIVINVSFFVAISLLILGIYNIQIIKTGEHNYQKVQTNYVEEEDVSLTLSRDGKNVVLFMLDRAIGGYLPFILDEKPELKESFDGFVYYPNTVSFGAHTIYGTPGLFGGYEYTPAEMNKRNTELLKDKHHEALKMLPTLFAENGYHVTVTDPPYAGYQTGISDLSIYDDIPGVEAFNLKGQFTKEYTYALENDFKARQKRNFIMYSIFRTVPSILKEYVYDDGKYLSVSEKLRYTHEFLDSYSALAELSSITKIVDDDENYFLMMQNDLAHQPTVLNPPEYAVDDETVISDEYSDRYLDGSILHIKDLNDWSHYCIHVLTFQTIAKWIDYLKEQGVYDNTRIIIVADHGYTLRQFDELIHPYGLDIEDVWPTLLTKDFNSHGSLRTDMTFMTNADAPVIATNGIIENPINPFTGNAIDDSIKQQGKIYITDSINAYPEGHQGTKYETGKNTWWTVHDNIFDLNNWSIVPDEEVGQ